MLLFDFFSFFSFSFSFFQCFISVSCYVKQFLHFSIEISKSKKVLTVIVWLFLIFLFLFFFFQWVSSVSCYVKQFLGGLYLFRIFFFVFKESTLQYWKKAQAQIMVFNKNAVVKISRISNSNSLPWNLSQHIFLGKYP